MTYKEAQARDLVVEAGHRLVECGLVARTWGNISARVSDTHFVITPSGRAYETLTPEQLVLVKMDTCEYEGSIKPSSEKGIHAAVYLRHPNVGFVIHTHQDYASAVGVGGKDLMSLNDPVLGTCVPCAAYGMPSTKKLQHGVESAMEQYPDAKAILMRQHGALCMARDFEGAFAISKELEAVCRREFESKVGIPSLTPASAQALCSQLQVARPDTHFSVIADPALLAVAAWGKTLHPHLDDLAQIAGVTIRSAANDSTAVLQALKNRDAALIPGVGAVCCAKDPEDLDAIGAIMKKSAMSALYAKATGAAPLSMLDRWIMRTVYTMKYAKKKKLG